MSARAAPCRARALHKGLMVAAGAPEGGGCRRALRECISGPPNRLSCDMAPRSAAHEAVHTNTGTGPRACRLIGEIPTTWKQLRHHPSRV